MRRKLRSPVPILVGLFALLAVVATSAYAESIDPASTDAQYAWAESIGWINFEPSGNAGPGAQVSGTKVTGWAWAEGAGWINLHCDNLGGCGTVNFGVSNNGFGTLSGYAWSEAKGWISFSCANTGTCGTVPYGVTIDPVTGVFSGKAWAEHIGWVVFDYSTSSANRVRTGGDGDVIPNTPQTLHRGPTNPDLTKDNCPFDTNALQDNNDGNYVDHSPPYAGGVEDKTRVNSDAPGDACDTDVDNDGRTDADEASGAGCGGAVTNAMLPDSDGDRALDGAECAIGTNPNDGGTDPGDRPTPAMCAAEVGVVVGTDTDSDRLKDYIEFCYYNSNRTLTDSDGDKALDGAIDGCEATSFNVDRIVNPADQGMLASGISGAVAYHPNVDVNKDGVLNPADSGLVASFRSPGGQCPG